MTRPPDGGEEPPVRAAGPAGIPSLGQLAIIGALFVLVPGLVLFIALSAAGTGSKIAGLSGLFAFLIGLGLFPLYLRRLGRRLPPR